MIASKIHCQSRIEQMHSKLFHLTVLLSLGLFWSASNIHAQLVDPPDLVNPGSAKLVKQLLRSDWQREPENQANSHATFTSLQPNSTAVSLAYIINRIQHNETREALKVAEQLTEQDPESVDAWLLRSWLNALINKYERSLIDLRSLKKRIQKNQQLDKVQKQEIFSRMGKIIGYIQGPVRSKVSPDMIESSILAIAKGLEPAELEALNVSRETVLARFNNLGREQSNKTAVELEKQAAKDEIKRVSLVDDLQQLDLTLQQLSEEQERLTIEGNQQIADLNSQLGPLESELGTLSNQIRRIRYDLQLQYNSLFFAQSADVIYEPTIFYLTDRIRDMEYQLRSLRYDANSVSNQLQTVQVQISQTERDYNGQIRALRRQQNLTEKSKTRNRARLSKLAIGPEVAAGKKEAKTNRLTALTSYYELPVELYRQQMLDLVD